MLKFIYNGILLQEVPNEISIGFTLLGCPRHCKGCHSEQYWDTNIKDKDIGNPFNEGEVHTILFNKAFPEHEDASCICFFGGDWRLNDFLSTICSLKYEGVIRLSKTDSKILNYKFAWYTGLCSCNIPKLAWDLFDYIKAGSYDKELGPLTSKTTNQKLYSKSIIDLTHLFWRN